MKFLSDEKDLMMHKANRHSGRRQKNGIAADGGYAELCRNYESRFAGPKPHFCPEWQALRRYPQQTVRNS